MTEATVDLVVAHPMVKFQRQVESLVKKSKGKNIFLVDSSAYNYVFGRCSALGAELAKSASAELKQVPSAKVLEGQGVTVFRSL